MLSYIHLNNFVIVAELELEFQNGMTALTGETGAGKSILIDALGLALGDRADQDVIRHGAEQTEITVGFNLDHQPAIHEWLVQQDLAEDQECLVRRIISREGRSRAYINGRPTTLQQLKALGEQLVDIHGQHEHQSLMQRDQQRRILDEYASIESDVAALETQYENWREQQQQYDTLRQASRERSDRIDLLRFHAQELEALQLEPDELETLDEDYNRLANAGDLISQCQAACEVLYDADQSAHYLISQQLHQLQELIKTDSSLTDICDLLDSARIQLQEATDELRRRSEDLYVDPQRLQYLEQRIASVQQLARKHRVKPQELPAVLAQAQQELDQLDNADQHLDKLEKAIASSAASYRAQANKIHLARSKAAKALNKAITDAMQTLGMTGGKFEARVTPSKDEVFTRHGLDQVEFCVSANPGQPLAPLTKVASGGELSRISLAIQVITSQLNTSPTMIFDEVDTGIGGGIAEVVGQKLRTLGEHHQVLCVTHLPQVAAQAHHHLQVSKLHGDEITYSQIRTLSPQERVEEIARMLGGTEITETTLAHAREMVEGPMKKSGNKRGKK